MRWSLMGGSRPSHRVRKRTIWRSIISTTMMTTTTKKVRVGAWLVCIFFTP